MEKLQVQLRQAGQTLAKFHELAVKEELSDIERDAMIHRFILSYDVLWHCAHDHLLNRHGLDAPTPKRAILDCKALGLIDEKLAEEAIVMNDLRHKATRLGQTGDDPDKVAKEVRKYDLRLQDWLKQLQEKVSG